MIEPQEPLLVKRGSRPSAKRAQAPRIIAGNTLRGGDVKGALSFNVFQGDQINDHHLALAEKWAAWSRI